MLAISDVPHSVSRETFPTGVKIAILSLWGQFAVALSLALFSVWGMLRESADGIAFGFLLLGLSWFAPPAAACAIAVYGLHQRRKWAYRAALIVQIGLAIVPALVLVSWADEGRLDAVLTLGGLGTFTLLVMNLSGIIGLRTAAAVAWKSDGMA